MLYSPPELENMKEADLSCLFSVDLTKVKDTRPKKLADLITGSSSGITEEIQSEFIVVVGSRPVRSHRLRRRRDLTGLDPQRKPPTQTESAPELLFRRHYTACSASVNGVRRAGFVQCIQFRNSSIVVICH